MGVGVMTTTEAEQRRLLEAVSELRHLPPEDCGESRDPFLAVAQGIYVAAEVTADTHPHIGRVYVALGRLVLAVRHDLNEKESSNG